MSLTQVRTAALLICSILVTSACGYYYLFLPPPSDPYQLSEPLLSLSSEEGRSLLKSSQYFTDYAPLMDNFNAQKRRAYCGVASAVNVINALYDPGMVDQSSFFSKLPDATLNAFMVSFRGMSLAELAESIESLSIDTETVFASSMSLDEFRQTLKLSLRNPDDFMIANYSRSRLNQKPDVGHFSPLAAYHEDNDMVLILDVASHNYPPTWVPLPMLFSAMNTLDDSSNQYRGVLLVKR